MTNQAPIQISVEETKAALELHFAVQTGNLVVRNLALEKRIVILQTSMAQLEAELENALINANLPPQTIMSAAAAAIVRDGPAATQVTQDE